MTTKFFNLELGEGDLYQINTEDGIESTFDYFVVAYLDNKKVFQHPETFNYEHDALRFKKKIAEAGELNLDNWIEVDMRPLHVREAEIGAVWLDQEEAHYSGAGQTAGYYATV